MYLKSDFTFQTENTINRSDANYFQKHYILVLRMKRKENVNESIIMVCISFAPFSYYLLYLNLLNTSNECLNKP